MPGKLRHNLKCPVCSKNVIAVFHSWEGSRDKAVFEYLHDDHLEPCVITMPYSDGLVRYDNEAEGRDGIHR